MIDQETQRSLESLGESECASERFLVTLSDALNRLGEIFDDLGQVKNVGGDWFAEVAALEARLEEKLRDAMKHELLRLYIRGRLSFRARE